METQFTVVPTAAEWKRGLAMTRTRRFFQGKWADAVKSALLLLITLYCWIPFFWDGCRDRQSFMVGLVAALLLAALWLVPAISMEREAKALAAAGRAIRLTLTEEGLCFGEDGVFFRYEELTAQPDPDLLVLLTEDRQMVVLPRRCLDEQSWQNLTDRWSQKEE